MEKNFDGWHHVKQSIEKVEYLPTFKEREIWWCSVGINIGYEVFGKDEKFWRPVLILDKHNKHTFFGLPLGSVRKEENRYYFSFEFRGRNGSILLSQGRTFSSKRLSNIMGTLSDDKFEEVRKAFRNLFIK